MSIEYFLKFPYGTQRGVYLQHEFKLDALASHYDYTGNLYQEQMKKGYTMLFNEIKTFKQVSFYKIFKPLDFESVFSSRRADKGTIPFAFISAMDGKIQMDTLTLNDIRVFDFRYISLPDEDRTPLIVRIMLIANAAN